MKPVLNLDPPLPALFAMNDVMAFGAMVAIRERGLRGLASSTIGLPHMRIPH